jgi:hypothetical protein
MSRRSILIARPDPALAHSWQSFVWQGGSWRPLPGASDLRSLVASAIPQLVEADLTITARRADDVLRRGDPASLDVPANGQALIVCPIRNWWMAADQWASVWVIPSRSFIRVQGDRFVASQLQNKLREMLNEADLRERQLPHDRRELHVRHDLNALDLCPEAFPPPPGLRKTPEEIARDDAARKEKIDAAAKVARQKGRVQKGADQRERIDEHNRVRARKIAKKATGVEPE